MRFSRLAVVSLAGAAFRLSLVRAWAPFATTEIATFQRTTNQIFSRQLPLQNGIVSSSRRPFSSAGSNRNNVDFSLKASLMTAEEEVALKETEQDETHVQSEATTILAKGSVISLFRGGLTAVRIDEEISQANGAGTTPNVLSPVQQQNQKSSTGGGGDFMGHAVTLSVNGDEQQEGVVIAHRPPIVFVYGFDVDNDKMDGASVSISSDMTPVTVKDDQTVLQWDGKPLVVNGKDNKEDTRSMKRAMLAPIPQVKDIALINHPMLTGNTMVDVLSPIGQGQNMLLVVDDLAAARGMMCDFISTQLELQTNANTKFVYAVIDDGDDVLKRLGRVSDKVHVVLPTEDDNEKDEATKAAEATAMAASACAIAESYALEQGRNAVVIVDTLDQHKKFWDATTKVLVDEYGMEAVSDREGKTSSSEKRGFFSSIIQRAGQYKQSRGGGSVTLVLLCEVPKLDGEGEDTFQPSDFEDCSDKVKARIDMLVNKGIPLTATNLRKIEIPLPSQTESKRRLALQHIDDLISMSDGQIWLDETLRAAGQYPPIDPQKSITRVGIGADTDSRADAPALRRIAGGLRLALSQAANMDGAEMTTKASKQQLTTRNALLLAMRQVEGAGGRTLSESCTALLAALNGHLDNAVESGADEQLIQDMLAHVTKVAPAAMATIDQTLDLTKEVQQEIVEAIESFFSEDSS